MKSDPIMRDVKTGTDSVFGNIIGNPTPANLMADPLGTELVAGLTGPSSAQALPTDSSENMGQPPQVEFTGGNGTGANYAPADEDSTEVKESENMMASLMDRVKSLPAWGWLVMGGAVVGGVYISRRTPSKK